MNPVEGLPSSGPEPIPMANEAPVQTLQSGGRASILAIPVSPALPWPVATEVSSVSLAESVAIAEPRDAGERRGEDRAKLSIYRSATLHWRGCETLCLIRNFSTSGLMCHCAVPAKIGEPVQVEMRSGCRVAGRVAWVATGKIGIRFDAPIDVVVALAGGCIASPTFVQRMPRMHIQRPITLRTVMGTEAVIMLDLSQGGAKIEAPLLRAGERVTLCVPELAPRAGTVRWIREGRAGITFLTPIGFEVLAGWTISQQRPHRVGTGSGPE